VKWVVCLSAVEKVRHLLHSRLCGIPVPVPAEAFGHRDEALDLCGCQLLIRPTMVTSGERLCWK
jgi:hypothetical protein